MTGNQHNSSDCAGSGDMVSPGSRPFDRVRLILASALGLGLLPLIPGTFGAMLGLGFHACLLRLSLPWRLSGLAAGFLVASWGTLTLTPWAQAHWRNKDPREFVLDEVAGYLLTALLLSPILPTAWIMLGGFLAFRVVDQIKVPPARQIDRKGTGGWAILLDDCVSAVHAALLVWFIYYLGVVR